MEGGTRSRPEPRPSGPEPLRDLRCQQGTAGHLLNGVAASTVLDGAPRADIDPTVQDAAVYQEDGDRGP